MLYLLLKWLHVLGAIVVVGAHVTYGIWIVRASSDPHVLRFTLRNVKLLDERLSVPAYTVLLIAGVAMSFVSGVWTLPWLLTGQALFVILVVAHRFGYSPTLRRMIDLLDREGIESPNYQAAAGREAWLGIALIVLMVVIVFVMVVKPPLW